MSAEKTFNGLPGWAKGVIALGALAGVGISAYLIYQKVKKMADTKDSKREIDDVSSDLKSAIKSGKNLTLSASDIASIANNLKTAMDGYGTNYEMILKNIVKINNQSDLLAVIKSFGVRKISSGKLNPEPDFEGTLGQALAEELDNAQLTAVNNVLARKGISQRF